MNLLPPWQPIASVPRDGTLILLLLAWDSHRENATEDTTEPTTTIGANCHRHTGLDIWDLAGWDWTQDSFTAGRGTPIAWAPIPAWKLWKTD